ncbi:HutP family protein [Tepidibacter hydrothermalis]|uniref:Hut operon positive regulatory protein n=1 Tax=Tepidibacter hydrothermalis TaxID=3036126 RepID=A0ABY8ECS8_9FIRM|nr:HutP family protein [Tepidibacter hydrothermalis]WFD10734.1 HutP family protein [Tepidibacter hydrothermalis]
MQLDSTHIAKASIKIAITSSREDEQRVIKELNKEGIKAVAVDIGGNLIQSIPKVIERALVASRRSGVIKECHVHDGAVVGAAREAIMQVASKANGMNVGGKIGITRHKEHVSVCIFMSMGLLHLNDVVVGLCHRSIPDIY